MRRRLCGTTLLLAAIAASCTKPRAPDAPRLDAAPEVDAPATEGGAHGITDAAPPSDAGIADARAPVTREIGPFETPLDDKGKRKVYYAITASAKPGGTRLLANLHGVCNPPGYACGYWIGTAAECGFLVCPEGDGHCGGEYNPPTWTGGTARMDEDLERAIEIVLARHPGEVVREGAILTGFSRGAYAAVEIARRHPGRWPYLILNEADVALDAKSLEASGVKAVALIAGEYGSQVAGERATVKRLTAQKFPAKLWVMPKAGHFYSADIADIMREAIAFVLAER